MEKFLYLKKNSLSKELCNIIIKKFDEDCECKYRGVTSGGLNIGTKDTFDFQIPNSNNKNFESWKLIREVLENELNSNIKIYIQTLSKNIHKDFKLFENGYVTNETFQIQKYIKNNGKFTYHHDFSVEYSEKKYRVITFIYYLNDVNEGGETEIWGSVKIKPECGKLLLFPACWTFPHSGLVPKSNHKYIITGWLYMH